MSWRGPLRRAQDSGDARSRFRAISGSWVLVKTPAGYAQVNAEAATNGSGGGGAGARGFLDVRQAQNLLVLKTPSCQCKCAGGGAGSCGLA